jgi:hypothetical protein
MSDDTIAKIEDNPDIPKAFLTWHAAEIRRAVRKSRRWLRRSCL